MKRQPALIAIVLFLAVLTLSTFLEATNGEKSSETQITLEASSEKSASTILEALARIDKRFVEGVFKAETVGEVCVGTVKGSPAGLQGIQGAAPAGMAAIALEENLGQEEESACFSSFSVKDTTIPGRSGISIRWEFKGNADGGYDMFWCANSGKAKIGSEEKEISFKGKKRINEEDMWQKTDVDGVSCKFARLLGTVGLELSQQDIDIGSNVKFMAVAYDKDNKWLAETGWFAKDEGIYSDEK